MMLTGRLPQLDFVDFLSSCKALDISQLFRKLGSIGELEQDLAKLGFGVRVAKGLKKEPHQREPVIDFLHIEVLLENPLEDVPRYGTGSHTHIPLDGVFGL